MTNLTKELNACTANKNTDDGKSAETERLATKQKLFSFLSVPSSSSWNLLPFLSLTRLLLALTTLTPLLRFCQADLGFILDSKLSMKKHVIKICQTAYFELKRISSIPRRFITQDAPKTIVTSYILSRLDNQDYCYFLYPFTAWQPRLLLLPISFHGLTTKTIVTSYILSRLDNQDYCYYLYPFTAWQPWNCLL